MNCKFFNKGFYLEMFSQLRIPGFIGMVIYALAGILYPVGRILEEINYPSGEENVIFDAYYFYILYGLVFIGIPILMLVAFSYLNKRKTSDFYHAIPVRREAMFVGGIAAVVTWVIIITIVACVFTLAIVGIDGKLTIQMDMFFSIFITFCVCCVQMISGLALGIALTGNTFSSLLISIMIMFAPRILITIITELVVEFVPYMILGYGRSLLNNSYNAIIMVLSGGELGYSSSIMSSTYTYVYTLVLSVIYIIFAAVCFVKRKSETATNSASYKIVQDVSKMIPSYVLGICSLGFVLSNVFGGEIYYDEMNFFAALVFMIIAVVLYFIYDLVTTKNAKRILVGLKQLPIFFGLILCTGIVMFGGIKIGREREIKADEIKKICVVDADSLLTFLGYDYIDLDDSKINEIVENAYKRQLDKDKDEEYDSNWWVNVTPLLIGVNQGGTTFYRDIYFTKDEIKQIKLACSEVCMESKSKIDLPHYSERIRIDIADYYLTVNMEDERELYNCLKDELKNISYSELICGDGEGSVTKIYLNEYYLDGSYSPADATGIDINNTLPKTKKKLLELKAKSLKEEMDYYSDDIDDDDNYINVSEYEEWINTIFEKAYSVDSVNLGFCGTSACVEDASINELHMLSSEVNDFKEFTSILKKIAVEEENEQEYIYIEMFISLVDPEGFYDNYRIEICDKASTETASEIMNYLNDYMKNFDYNQ